MHHDAPRPPPDFERRFGAPGVLLGRLALVAALPLAAAFGYWGPDAWQRSVRIAIVFCILLALFRVIGKRELGRLSPFELVTLMLVPEVLSNAIQGQGDLLGGIVGLTTLFLLVLVTSTLAHRFKFLERVVEAQPTVLVANGRVIDKALNEERITAEELFSEMRKHGLSELAAVRWAILEGGGDITFVPMNGTALRNGQPGSGAAP
jgi:uncharacterized membrane protein YcaP (DUF421 family)